MSVKPDSAGWADPRFMQSLARGLEVLRAFEGHTSLTVSQAAAVTGLPRSSVARCLFTLERLGYVVSDGPVFRLLPTLLPLARSYLGSDVLARSAAPAVTELRERLGESCSAAVLDPADPCSVIYICRSEVARIISMPLLIGSTLPSYCTSMGRILLAQVPEEVLTAVLDTDHPLRTPRTITDKEALRAVIAEAGQQGYALVDEELELGMRSIAVPVRGGHMAINLAIDAARRDAEWLREVALPELCAAATHISRAL